MGKFHSYLSSAAKLIAAYTAGKPLPNQIKSFFAADKKFGSSDRRTISSLCYYYFRTGKAFDSMAVEEKILMGLFLFENKRNDLLHFFHPHLDDQITLPLPEKMTIAGISGKDIFSFYDETGNEIDKEAFSISFLQQPRLYLRIRPRKKNTVTDKLNAASVTFEWIGDDCIVLENKVPVDTILKLNKDAVVQDMNSQKVLDFLSKTTGDAAPAKKIKTWDCCAASGGKSILAFDKLQGNIQLTVSDIRENILFNLGKRLQQAGVNINRSFLADLSVSSGLPADELFSIIICDAPCTGSGTWGRNPEQLRFFDAKMIDDYAARQQKIVRNVIPHLQESGLFFYITCSVFTKENENIVSYIKDNFPALQCMQSDYLKGYENAADTMFVAVFSKKH